MNQTNTTTTRPQPHNRNHTTTTNSYSRDKGVDLGEEEFRAHTLSILVADLPGVLQEVRGWWGCGCGWACGWGWWWDGNACGAGPV